MINDELDIFSLRGLSIEPLVRSLLCVFWDDRLPATFFLDWARMRWPCMARICLLDPAVLPKPSSSAPFRPPYQRARLRDSGTIITSSSMCRIRVIAQGNNCHRSPELAPYLQAGIGPGSTHGNDGKATVIGPWPLAFAHQSSRF